MFRTKKASLSLKRISSKKVRISKKLRNNAFLRTVKKNTSVVTSNSTVHSPVNASRSCDSIEKEPICDSIKKEPICDSIEMETICDSIEMEPICDSIKKEPICDSIKKEPICDSICNDNFVKMVNLLSHSERNSVHIETVLKNCTKNCENFSVYHVAIDMQNIHALHEYFKNKNLLDLKNYSVLQNGLNSADPTASVNLNENKGNFNFEISESTSYSRINKGEKIKPYEKLSSEESEILDYEYQTDDLETELNKNNSVSFLSLLNSSSLKDFRISVNANDNSEEKTRKESFYNYNVTIPPSNNLIQNDAKDCNSYFPLLVKKTSRKSSTKDLLNEKLRAPKDFLERAKSMKITIQDSERILSETSVANKAPKNNILNKRPSCKNEISQKSEVTDKFNGTTDKNNKCRNKVKQISRKKKKTNNFDLKLKSYQIVNPPLGDDENNVLSSILKEPVEIDLGIETFAQNQEIFCSSEEIDKTCLNNNLEQSMFETGEFCKIDLKNKFVNADYSDDETSSDEEHSFKRMRKEHILEPEKDFACNFPSVVQNNIRSKEIGSSNSSTLDNISISSLSSVYERNSSCPSSAISKEFSKLPLESFTLPSQYISSIVPEEIVSKEEIFQTGTLQEVIEAIKMLCSKNELREALFLSAKYIPISSPDARTSIFIALFISIVKDSNLDDNSELCQTTFNDLQKILSDNNMFDSFICSTIIYQCLSSNFNTLFATEVYEKCMKYQMQLSEETLFSIATFLIDKKSVSDILMFLDYLNIIEFTTSTQVLQLSLLESCTSNKNVSIPELKKLCDCLSNYNFPERNCSFLQEFFKNCMEDELWPQICKIVFAQLEKDFTVLIHHFCQAIATPLNESGNNFEKFAASVFSSFADLGMKATTLISQIGVLLMLETYHCGEFKSAFAILVVLHKYNIDYMEMQLPLSILDNFPFNLELEDPFGVCTSKASVLITATNILLHFKRQKDAFDLFQGFSVQEINSCSDPSFKTIIMSDYYSLLLKIADGLLFVDPFERGLTALKMLLSVEEEGFELRNGKSYITALSRIYSSYLAKLLNEEKYDAAIAFHEENYGPCKEKLNIFPYVRRSLLLTYINKGMLKKAKTLFYIGCTQKNYQVNAISGNYPTKLQVNSSWTVYEIKFALEMLFENLHPFLLYYEKEIQDKDKTFNELKECFSISLRIKVEKSDGHNVKCLKELPSDIDSSINRVKEVLKMIDSDLKYCDSDLNISNTVVKCVNILPESLYSFWKKKFCSPEAKTINNNFIIKSRQRISFGKNETERAAEDFEKITQFLRAKLLLKYKDSSSDQIQQKKATELAITFIKKNNVYSKLDKKTMKILNDFSENVL